MQYLGTFRLYSPSVLILAAGNTVLVSLLKKTVLKNCPKKLFVFLPFLIGIVLYAIFHAVCAGLCSALAYSFAETLEGGFACGCAATLYYVAYEQFFRKKGENVEPLFPLLDGLVAEENREEVVALLKEHSERKTDRELSVFVEQTLRSYGEATLTEGELLAATRLISAYLTELKKLG